MPTPAIQTLINDAQQVLNLDSISAVRSVVAVSLANANTGTPLNPNLTTQQLWNEFYQVVTRSKSDIESIIANQLMKFLYSPPAPGGVGANKQVIFNDGGVLAGDAGLTYDKATDALTISGNLTVDTSTFAVDAANNRVFVGTAPVSTAYPLFVTRGGTAGSIAQFTDGTAQTLTIDSAAGGLIVGNANNGYVAFTANGLEQYRIAPLGVFTWADGAGGTRMTLNSTGLGVGVTPSAWATLRGLQNGRANLVGYVSNSEGAWLTNNAFYDGSWKYQTSAQASHYQQLSGVHSWSIAATGTAGTAISFTQAMTLAANGQLLLGTSTTTGSVDIGMVLNKPSATGFVGNVYQLNGVEKAFTYISSAAGAFRVDTVTGYTINMVSATNGVYLANGGTSWTALSDERFKDIIEPISNAVAKVGSIRSVIGKFKTESEGTRRSFLIAQDVQAVLPEAVDASNPEKLGVSYTEVIPLLVAAIKELTARVQTLETR